MALPPAAPVPLVMEQAGRFLNEIMYTFVPEMDYVVPEGIRLAGVSPRPRKFAPLGIDFQDELLMMIRARWPGWGEHLLSSTLSTRMNGLYLPPWLKVDSRWKFYAGFPKYSSDFKRSQVRINSRHEAMEEIESSESIQVEQHQRKISEPSLASVRAGLIFQIRNKPPCNELLTIEP